MLSWKDKFDEAPCAFQLRLGAGVRGFRRVGLRFRTGRVDLVQNIYSRDLSSDIGAGKWTYAS